MQGNSCRPSTWSPSSPPKKPGLRGECWPSSSLVWPEQSPRPGTGSISTWLTQGQEVLWPQTWLGGVPRSPSVSERLSSLGCQWEQPEAGNGKMELVRISWAHPTSACRRWELEEDGPGLVVLPVVSRGSSEAKDAFSGLWRCVACGACKNLACPCSVEDFSHP